MAITAYTGLPGSGKSYEVVNGPILTATARGRVVWTNIPCKIDGVTVIKGAQLDGHWYLKAPPGALVVIDECWRYWPSGMKANEISEEIKDWFAMHRHRTGEGTATDIAIVTQDLSQIASFVRNLVEQTFRMKKLSAIFDRNTYRVDAYDGAVTGQRPPEGRHIAGSIRRYQKEGFARYQSHTQGGAAAELTIDKRGSVWRRASVIAIPAAIAAVLLVPKVVGRMFGSEAKEHAAERPAHAKASVASASVPGRAAPVPVTPAPAPAPEVPKGPQESKEWTLLGVATRKDGSGVALLRSSTGRRQVDASLCEHAAGVQWRCMVDGEIVAEWTGNGVFSRVVGTTYSKANAGG